MTYNAYVCTITEIRPHPNADRLALTTLYGSQVVIGIDVKIGDRGIYFPTDGQLSEEFCTQNNLLRKVDSDGKNIGGMFDTNRRVRTQTLRGEKSDGFWCPLTFLSYITHNVSDIPDNTLISDWYGQHICNKYITASTKAAWSHVKKPRIKTSYPNFHQHIDTEQFMYNLGEFNEGDYVIITEKLHGTSGRSAYTCKVTGVDGWKGIINRLLRRQYFPVSMSYEYVCGSRKVVLSDLYVGYHGSEDKVIRQQCHELFVGKLHKGESVYYEIVGWQNFSTPIMNKSSNKALGKEFIKQYGDTTTFTYGCLPGTQEVYVYRMSMTNEDGFEVDYCWDYIKERCAEMQVNWVPEIDIGVITNKHLFQLDVEHFVSGQSLITPQHIKEGVVVRIDGTQWKAWKHKSWEFKVIEGICKNDNVIDLEEAS